MEKKQKPGKETAKTKRVKMLCATYQAAAKPWLDGVKAAGILNPSIFTNSYIAQITVSWEGEVRNVITPVMIKKKIQLDIQSPGWTCRAGS